MVTKSKVYKRDVFRAQAKVVGDRVRVQIWTAGIPGRFDFTFNTNEWRTNMVDQQKMLAQKLQEKFPNDEWDWLSLNLDAVRHAAAEVMAGR